MQCPIATMQFFRKNSTFYASLFITAGFFLLFSRLELLFHGADIPGSLALQFSYGKAAFHAILQGWTPEGITIFRWMLLVDMLFPFVYGTLLVSSLMRLNEPRIVFYPMVVSSVMLDLVENVLHLLAVSVPSLFILGPLGAVIATLKWLLITLVVLRIVMLYVSGLFHSKN